MAEKHLVAGAQVVQASFAIWSVGESMLGTLAIAGKPNVAFAAVSRQRRFLRFAETALLVGLDKCLQRGLHDVSEAILRIDEVIAGVQVTAMLNGERCAALLAALLSKDAGT